MSYTYNSIPPEKILGKNETNPITAPTNNQVPVYNSTTDNVNWGTAPSTTPTNLNISGQTTGDIIYFNGTIWIRLGIGSASQVLTVTSGIPSWTTPASASTPIWQMIVYG